MDATSARARCSATAWCCPGRRSRPGDWSSAASTAWTKTARSADSGLQLPDHVLRPGVVAQSLLVADDLLSLWEFEGQPGGGLAVVRPHLQTRAVPGG